MAWTPALGCPSRLQASAGRPAHVVVGAIHERGLAPDHREAREHPVAHHGLKAFRDAGDVPRAGLDRSEIGKGAHGSVYASEEKALANW